MTSRPRRAENSTLLTIAAPRDPAVRRALLNAVGACLAEAGAAERDAAFWLETLARDHAYRIDPSYSEGKLREYAGYSALQHAMAALLIDEAAAA